MIHKKVLWLYKVLKLIANASTAASYSKSWLSLAQLSPICLILYLLINPITECYLVWFDQNLQWLMQDSKEYIFLTNLWEQPIGTPNIMFQLSRPPPLTYYFFCWNTVYTSHKFVGTAVSTNVSE